MNRVYTANAPGSASMGSFGRASYMLIRQVNFPDAYEDGDTLLGWDHDRIMSNDYDHARRCFTEHTGTGELGLQGWAERASAKDLIAFCADILKADPAVTWTGCRIMGTVNVSNGYPVWTIEVFAKGPESKTKTYSGGNAPNVKLSTMKGPDGYLRWHS